MEGGRPEGRKAEGGRRKAEGRRRKAEGGRRKLEGGKWKVVIGRGEVEGGWWKVVSGKIGAPAQERNPVSSGGGSVDRADAVESLDHLAKGTSRTPSESLPRLSTHRRAFLDGALHFSPARTPPLGGHSECLHTGH